MREAASSLLVSGFSCQFSHRMNIRCFLTRFFGQEDEPSELQHMRRKKKGDGHESEKSDRHKEYTGSHPGG